MQERGWRKPGDDSTARIKSRREAGGRFPSIAFISCVGPLYHTQQSNKRNRSPPKPGGSSPRMGGSHRWWLGLGDVMVAVPVHR